MRGWFEKADGEAVPFPEILSAELGAVVLLMGAVGIRRIDRNTIDEFVRRADLYDTYVAGWLFKDGEQVSMTRKILVDSMEGYPAIWSDGEVMGEINFDRMIRQAKTNRLTNQQ